MENSNNTAYDRVTDRILELLENGVCPWRRPWNRQRSLSRNFMSKRPYSGINWFLLGVMGFDSPWFMTFNQVRAKGGSVIRGSKGIPIVYWGTFEAEDRKEKTAVEAVGTSGESARTRKIPFLKAYVVFNACQIEGVTFPELPKEVEIDFQPITAAEKIVMDWVEGPEILHGYGSACYVPAIDTVKLLVRTRFTSAEEYYCTLFHELGHATGSPRRLNRDMGSTVFGSADYSREELVAEMTAAFLCAQCGIDNSVIENSAAYLQGWIKALKGDKKLVVTAASQAQKAANMILGRTSDNE